MKHIDMSEFNHAVADLAIRGIIVMQDDEELLHHQYVPEAPQNQYSVTKSFTATAVGFAACEGLFRLDEPVVRYFHEEAPEEPSENLQRMTIRDLLTMSMGFPRPMLMGGEMRAQIRNRDWVRDVLHTEVTDEPGTVFRYNNAGPYLLGLLVERCSGMDLFEYLTPRLFEPLGMEVPVPERDGQGRVFGAGGMVTTVSNLVPFGQFWLHRGEVNGRELLPDAWFGEASAPHIGVGAEGDDEVGTGYGYLFWTMPDGAFRADGRNGQYVVILPRHNAVIAVNSMEYGDARAILRAVLRHIVPQL